MTIEGGSKRHPFRRGSIEAVAEEERVTREWEQGKQGGSQRHPSQAGSITTGGHFQAVQVPPDGYVPGEFISYRTLDPVRAAALAAAVELCCRDAKVLTREVLTVAKDFEQYLTGEEADGPPNP